MPPRRTDLLVHPLLRASKRSLATRVLLVAGTFASVLTAPVLVAEPAAAAETYTVEMQAWIPHSFAYGPVPLGASGWSPLCSGLTTPWRYNGNNHANYDGSAKARVRFTFAFDGNAISKQSVTTDIEETVASFGLCTYRKRATTGITTAITGSRTATLRFNVANPLVAPANDSSTIDEELRLNLISADHLRVHHQTEKFPSAGFRVWRNGRRVATAVNFDASCKSNSPASIFAGLRDEAPAITHDVDTRASGLNYFGPCGAARPPALTFPAVASPDPTPPPVTQPPPSEPANTPPTASFLHTRRPGVGNLVRLNGGGSKDSDGSIKLWTWRSGSRLLGYGSTLDISAGAVTSLPVTLTVHDNYGASASLTRTLSLPNRAPRVLALVPTSGQVFFSNQPTLGVEAVDDDGDRLEYSYRVTGSGTDVSSGWVAGAWRVPPHRLDPGASYQWSAQIRDNVTAPVGRTSSFVIAMLPTAKQMVSTSDGRGYWQVASDGGVFSYGGARFHGSVPGLGIKIGNAIGMARTPSDDGYWVVGRDGGVFSFGAAPFKGSLPGINVRVDNIVGMAPTKSGQGYWLVGSDGGVFAFGDAGFYGSMGGKPLNGPVEAIAPTASGAGYWLVARDGGVFSFGDAAFHGSMGGQILNAPVIDLQVTPSGKGYWLAAEDGGVFTFGDARFFGSLADQSLNGRIVSLTPTGTGKGYWLNGCDGGVFSFGDAPFYGSNPTYGCRGT